MNKGFSLSIFLVAFTFLLLTMSYATSPVLGFSTSSSADDWTMFHHDPEHTGFSTSSAPVTPTFLWNVSTSGNQVDSSPSVVNGRVYVGSSNGNVYCLDAFTGTQIWLNFEIQVAVYSSPAVVDDKVYVGSLDGRVYCLDSKTGNEVWSYTTDDWIRSSPAVVNGYLYISSADGNIYCLNAQTGARIWNYTTGGPFTSGMSSPAVTSGLVYVGGNSFYCLDASSGAEIWTYPVGVRSSPAVSGDYVYVSADDGNVYCLDALSGATIWNFPHRDAVPSMQVSSPALADGFLYVGGDGVYCLDASTGTKIWSYITGFVVSPSPAVAGGYVYCGSNNADTYCLDAQDGTLVWTAPTGDYESSPAVVNGVVYVGGYSVYAFGEPSTVPSSSVPLLTIIGVAVVATVAIIVAAFLVYMKKRKGKQHTVPSHKLWSGKLNKRLLPLVVLALIVVVAVSSFVVLYHDDFLAPHEPSHPKEPPTILWQSDLEHFATDIAVADGKTFTSNIQAGYCFDAQNGRLLWETDIHDTKKVEVYAGKVYTGSRGSVVNRLNENTGKLELTYQAPVSTSYGSKVAPDYFVADGRVFASQNGIAVYNASTGELFWELPSFGGITLGNASASATESDYVFIWYNSRVNPTNGNTLWSIQGSSSDPPIVTDGKVIFWNYDPAWNPDAGQAILCVNASSGDTLWSFDAGAPVFQPTIYNSLLLFGASDGNFYALHTANGAVEWKTRVDTQNIMAGENLPAEAKFDSPPAVSPVVVDSRNQNLLWCFAVTQYGIEGVGGNDQYVGILCSLDPANGDIIWTNQIVRNGSISNGPPKTPILGLASLDGNIFLTARIDLWIIDESTGNPIETQHFEHFLLPPVVYDNKVFVAADLYLITYG
jgi:outer membrane protein assembly factor BamB